MALADAKLMKGEDAEKVLDFIVKLERSLRNCASDLLAMDAALLGSKTPKPSGEPAVEEVRKALIALQESKGKKNAQAALNRYARTGTLGSLKAEDRARLLADVRRLLTLRSVK
jgi:hypothetical protein